MGRSLTPSQRCCLEINSNAKDLAVSCYARTGQPELALADLTKRFPNKDNQFQYVLHGLYKSGNGQFQEALEDYRQWEKLVDVESADNWFSINDWHRYGQALVKTGNDSLGVAMMRKQLSIFRKRMESNELNYYDMAGIYAFLNMRDSAYYYLEKTFQDDLFLNGWGNASFILVDFQFDNIRSDQRFIELFEKEKEKMREIRKQLAIVDPDYHKVN